jgi:WD repeat-containing protein 19
VHDGAELHVYVYMPSTMKGAVCVKTGEPKLGPDGALTEKARTFPLPAGVVPIVARGGWLTCQGASGAIETHLAECYSWQKPGRGGGPSTASPMTTFLQCMALLRLKDAWRASLKLDDRNVYLALARRAMEMLDVDLAIRVYVEEDAASAAATTAAAGMRYCCARHDCTPADVLLLLLHYYCRHCYHY